MGVRRSADVIETTKLHRRHCCSSIDRFVPLLSRKFYPQTPTVPLIMPLPARTENIAHSNTLDNINPIPP